jgi:hypothetical protein
MDASELTELLPLLAPLVLIQLGLMVTGLLDLAKAGRRTKGPKWAWVLVVVLFSLIGPLAYFLFGREEA